MTALSVSKNQMRNQAFAIGFFGFHYIRAVNENHPLLQRESLEILRQLADASHLDAELVRLLHSSRKQSYSDYWNNTLMKIALLLGDSHGEEIQYGVKLSFELAAVYAYLYGVLAESGSKKITACLSILEIRLSGLLASAQRANISELTVESLIELTELLQGSKTYPTACKCMRKLKTTIKDILDPLC